MKKIVLSLVCSVILILGFNTTSNYTNFALNEITPFTDDDLPNQH